MSYFCMLRIGCSCVLNLIDKFTGDALVSEEFRVALDRFCRQVNWHNRSCFLEFPRNLRPNTPCPLS